jgi:hypothetical protein
MSSRAWANRAEGVGVAMLRVVVLMFVVLLFGDVDLAYISLTARATSVVVGCVLK